MENKTYEFSGATQEEAVEAGLAELGVTLQEVDIEVLDSGSKGIFGLGSRPVRIAIRPATRFTGVESVIEKIHSAADGENNAFQEEKENSAAGFYDAESELGDGADETDETYSGDVLNENTLSTTITVVEDLLGKMHIRATVEGKIDVRESSGDQPMVIIDIKGEDLSYLIGRHSETLNAFQYITSLIVGREVGHWVPILVDIQGYRERRERQLHQMALKMADQVVKSRRRMPLEPMTGLERRTIHLILRDRSDVYTESVGEEPNRKVVIYPREE